ncbi:MAG TPA: PIN domain-containing protein [Rhodothermales bacterium]|nr:PIN domain-containing protein [Rhodothermales bacterium]
MKLCLDTSVLVPALVAAHPHHGAAKSTFERIEGGAGTLVLSAHALAEAYATLTALPLTPKISPTVAARLLRADMLAEAEVVALDGADYADTLARVAALGLTSGAIYDALHVRAAEKAGADELVTFNGRDFRRFPPAPPTQLIVL